MSAWSRHLRWSDFCICSRNGPDPDCPCLSRAFNRLGLAMDLDVRELNVED